MIAFLINELDIRGGTHKQLLKLLEYTATQTEDFFIVTKKVDFDKTYPGFEKFKDKIRIFQPMEAKKNIFGKISSYYRNISSLRSIIGDAECINVHDQGFEKFLGAFKGKKVVWQVNDLPYFFQAGVSKNTKLNWKSRLIKKFIVNNRKFVDKFTVNVSKNRERIQIAFNRDAEVLYCGIEPININRDVQLSLNQFADNKVNLLSSGVFFPYRNYETQIEVVKNLIDSGIEAHLNIIGATNRDEVYSNKIRQLISEKGLEKHITICGQVDEEKFKALHEESDIFMFINVDQSWGLAVFEAMSCGLPVIVSESVGATEILNDTENALFVNPTDYKQISSCIIDLMHNSDLYIKLSEAGIHFHENYTWDKAYSIPMYSILTSNE